MNTNKFIYPASSLLLTSGLCFAQERDAVATTERPNVIYLLCDDMGYSDIEAYGQQMISTPNLNRLVNKGMSFTQFYASTAVSAPSRASLMTGQHTGHTKIRGNKEIQPEGQEPLDPNVETLGHLFQQNGYVTGCFGKWGMGYPGSGGEANKMGFDVFYGYNCQRKAHSYYPEYLWNNQEKEYQNGRYSQDAIHEHAMKFIEDNKDKAFFGYFTYTIPHAELCQPQDSIVDMYKGKFQEPHPWYDNGDYGTRKIDGIYYCFDDDGILQMGWKNVRGSSDSIKDYMYFGSDGKAKIGWYSIEPPEDLEGYDGDVEWFYFANNGKPKAADSDHLTTQDLTKISGKTYLFNKRGNPVYGLKKVYIGSGDSNWTAFYFGTKTQSCVQRGKMKVEEDDGNKTDFYFSENGRGYTGVKDNYLYYKGKLQKATDGQKYVCYKIDSSNYVVNSSGKVMKNSTVKTSDGVKFKTSSSGSLSTADDDNDVSSYFTEPEEPNCTED